MKRSTTREFEPKYEISKTSNKIICFPILWHKYCFMQKFLIQNEKQKNMMKRLFANKEFTTDNFA